MNLNAIEKQKPGEDADKYTLRNPEFLDITTDLMFPLLFAGAAGTCEDDVPCSFRGYRHTKQVRGDVTDLTFIHPVTGKFVCLVRLKEDKIEGDTIKLYATDGTTADGEFLYKWYSKDELLRQANNQRRRKSKRSRKQSRNQRRSTRRR